jgi:hypothetical protein
MGNGSAAAKVLSRQFGLAALVCVIPVATGTSLLSGFTKSMASGPRAHTGSSAETYYRSALAVGVMQPKANVGASRSQTVDSLAGKILSRDPDTEFGMPSNLFYDFAEQRSDQTGAWALGQRKRFRVRHKVATGASDPALGDPGTFPIGSVGWMTWEDWRILRSAGQISGWLAYEGALIKTLLCDLCNFRRRSYCDVVEYCYVS